MASTNNWGSSTGFGKSSSFSGLSGSSGGLFGTKPTSTTPNSLAPPSSNLFGNTLQNQTNQSGGLFGNSNQSTNDLSTPAPKRSTSTFGSSNPSASSNLFGNSTNNTNNASSTPRTGLFGSSASAQTGGLFGNSNTQNTTAPTGGLFGNSSTQNNNQSGGLFGNSNTQSSTTQSGGLLGSSNSQNPAPQGGLFGNSKPGGLFGSSNTQSAQTGGLFGSNNQSNNQSNLFGSNLNNQSSGLFGGQSGGLLNNQTQGNVQASISNNPYSYDQAFNNIQRDLSTMPLSITDSLFQKNTSKKSTEPSLVSQPKSLLSRLGQTFKIFKSSQSTASGYGRFSILKGLFTQPSTISVKHKQSLLPKSSSHSKKFNKKSFRTSYNSSDIGDFKRLVIKSKPLRYHLINADRVLSSKRRKVLNDSIAPRANALNYSEDLSDDDQEAVGNRFSHKIKEDDHVFKSKDHDVLGESFTQEIKDEDDLDDKESNNGYWCSPTIKELKRLTLEELTNVNNFIIGRVGCGQIAYNYPVDLSGIFSTAEENGISVNVELFGKIIKLEKRTVLAYDNVSKPSLGLGLNIPATITLIVPCAKNKTLEEHIKRLQSVTGTEFITFDPITFQWVFKVKHFSVWGLVDEGEENETQTEKEERNRLIQIKRKQDTEEAQADEEYSRIFESGLFVSDIKRKRMDRVISNLPGGWNYDSSDIVESTTSKNEIIDNEISQQIAKYSQEKSTNALANEVSDITLDSQELEGPASPESLVFDLPDARPQDETGDFDYLKQLVTTLPKNVDLKELVDEKAYEPEIAHESDFDIIHAKPNLAVSNDWLVQLELANDINSSLTPYVTSKTAAPRILNIEKIDDLLFGGLGQHESQSDNQTDIQLKTTKQIVAPEYEEHYPENVSKIIYILLSKSEVEKRGNEFPKVAEVSQLSFKDFILNSVGDEEDSNFLKLASSLFDNVSLSNSPEYKDVDLSNATLVAYLTKLLHRKIVSDWLVNFNKPTIKKLLEKSENALEEVFYHVCERNLKAAVTTAINSNNAHLSVLLTLIDSNDSAVRSIASSQLEYWTQSNTIQYIPVPVVNIYKILAGNLDEVSQGLPWNVILALKIFYGDASQELHALINDTSLDEKNPYVDLLRVYHLMVIEDQKNACAIIKSSTANVKLRWILFQVLAHELIGCEELNDELSEKFGKHLEAIGLYKEAISVFSHLHDDTRSRSLIRSVVMDNVPEKNQEEENYLTKVLKVPPSLIYEAIANVKHTQGDFWQEGKSLVVAKLWEKAHAVISEQLGPVTIVSDTEDRKAQLLELIASFPQNGSIIADWGQGAGVYASYLNITEKFDNDEEIDIQQLESLLTNLALVKSNDSFDSHVALKLMSKRVSDIALAYKDQIPNLKHKILSLKLGENEKEYFSVRI